MSCRIKRMSSAVTARPRYRQSAGICCQCARTKSGTQALKASFLCAYASPHRCSFRIRIARGKQQLGLMRSQCFRRLISRRPPSEAAFREAFGGKPEPLAIVGEDSDRLAAPAPKDEQASGKRIGIELFPAELRQRIDALPAVDGFNRNQDAQLRRDLNQDADSHNSRLSVARYEADAFFNWIRSLPRRPSSSRVHSGSGFALGVTSSTNVGGGVFDDIAEA